MNTHNIPLAVLIPMQTAIKWETAIDQATGYEFSIRQIGHKRAAYTKALERMRRNYADVAAEQLLEPLATLYAAYKPQYQVRLLAAERLLLQSPTFEDLPSRAKFDAVWQALRTAPPHILRAWAEIAAQPK